MSADTPAPEGATPHVQFRTRQTAAPIPSPSGAAPGPTFDELLATYQDAVSTNARIAGKEAVSAFHEDEAVDEAAPLAALRAHVASLESRLRDVGAVHLRRHTRLANALAMDPGYSVDGTIDEAIRRLHDAAEREAAHARMLDRVTAMLDSATTVHERMQARLDERSAALRASRPATETSNADAR